MDGWERAYKHKGIVTFTWQRVLSF